MPTIEQTIQSDAFVFLETTKSMASDGHILVTTEQSINSDAFIGQEAIQTIDSDAVTLVTQTKIITSSTYITPVFIFEAETDLAVVDEEEILVETDSSNPIPAAPTSLVASDTGVGDSVDLSWVSTAPFFNIYRKEIGPIFTKLNPLPIETTTYQAGALPQGVAITFIVRGVNGLGQESTDSNEATATPTLNTNLERFVSPTWTVAINSTIDPDAILSSISISYGSTFSTAVFSLPFDFRTGGPVTGSTIEIKVNGQIVFRGKIKIRADILDESGGLRASYTCYSNIIDFTTTTLNGTDVDMISTTFNVFAKQPDGKGRIQNFANANDILTPLGIQSVPAVFPGTVDITDLTPLAAMELVLQKLGNYKVYHRMTDDETFAYRFGSGGFNVRAFKFGDASGGGNIINYNIQTSNQDVIKQVIVIGAPTQVRIKKTLSDLDIGVDPDGRRRLITRLTGKNIRDIQVFGFARSKPIARFNENVQVLLEDLDEDSGFKDSAIDNSFGLSDEAGGSSTGDENTASVERSLRPIITSMSRFSSQRQSIGARIFYGGSGLGSGALGTGGGFDTGGGLGGGGFAGGSAISEPGSTSLSGGRDSVIISINTVPKKWFAVTRSGNVENVKIGVEGEGTTSVSVLLRYGWFPGSLEVEYTIDEEKPSVTAGSGTPSKSITDSQYQIINDPVNGFDNTDDITTRMNARASNELARLQKENQAGSITVIGDETLDLRSSVSVNGELLEISGITHTFENGFLSTVELTNEPFFTTIIIPPSLVLQGGRPKEKEKGRRHFIDDFGGRILSEADNSKYLAAQKEDIDRDTDQRGPFAIYQD